MTPDPIALGALTRALVIKFGHLGDVLLASPVVSVLKAHAPGIEVDALVYAETAPMLEGHPGLSRLFTIDRAWRGAALPRRLAAEIGLLARMRARSYDLVVCLSDKPRGAWLTRLLRPRYAVARERAGWRRFWQGSFTHLYPIPSGNVRHTVEVHLDALRRIGIAPAADDCRVSLVPGADAERHVDRLLAEHGLKPGGFLLVHPGSRWLFKCWPAARVAALIDLLQERGERIVLTGAGDDNESPLTDELLRSLRQPVVNAIGRLTLPQLAALIGRARLFIGVDSAPMHMASAMRTPAVAMFGPSSEIEWGPWKTAHRIVASDHACRPCSLNGCGGGNRSECVESIAVERVLAAINELLIRRVDAPT